MEKRTQTQLSARTGGRRDRGGIEAVSLMTIVAFVAGYLFLVVVVLGMLQAGKRADASEERQHEDLVRSKTPPASARFASRGDRSREVVRMRRSG